MAAAAELEETRASSSPASLSRARFSPLKGNQSPSLVSLCSHFKLVAKNILTLKHFAVQARISLNTVTEQLTEELDTVPQPARSQSHSGLILMCRF
jgi:hypothetical protein